LGYNRQLSQLARNFGIVLLRNSFGCYYLQCVPAFKGACGGVVVEALRFKLEGRGFDFQWSHYGHCVDSASNRNEYQEYFLGVKAAGA
jgi:hypothetical protein